VDYSAIYSIRRCGTTDVAYLPSHPPYHEPDAPTGLPIIPYIVRNSTGNYTSYITDSLGIYHEVQTEATGDRSWSFYSTAFADFSRSDWCTKLTAPAPGIAMRTQLFLTETSTSLESDHSTISDVQSISSTTQAGHKKVPPSLVIPTVHLSVDTNAAFIASQAAPSNEGSSTLYRNTAPAATSIPDTPFSVSGSRPAGIIASLLGGETSSHVANPGAYSAVEQSNVEERTRSTAVVAPGKSTILDDVTSASTQAMAEAPTEGSALHVKSIVDPNSTLSRYQSELAEPQGNGAVTVAPKSDAGGSTPPHTVSDTSKALPSEGFVNENPTTTHAASQSGPTAMFTLGSLIYTIAAGQPAVLGTHTFSLSAPAITLGQDTVSMASNGLVVGNSTATFPAASAASEAVLTLGSSTTVTAGPDVPVTLGSYTVSAGGNAATIGVEIVSVASDGVIIGNLLSTYTVAFTAAPTDATSTSSLLGIGGVVKGGLQGPTISAFSNSGTANTTPSPLGVFSSAASPASMSLERVLVASFVVFMFVWFICMGPS